MDGQTIQVTVFIEGKRGYRRVWRKATRYQNADGRETCMIRVNGQDAWAERFPGTVWTVNLNA